MTQNRSHAVMAQPGARPAKGQHVSREWIAGRIARLFIPEPNTGCWLWLGALDRDGYGTVQAPGNSGKRRAHRFVYEFHCAPIAKNLQLDHRCHVRSCVNPDHLRPATAAENIAAAPRHVGKRAACPAGHPYAGDNLVINTNGRRICRECRNKRAREKKRAAKLSREQLELPGDYEVPR